MPQNFPSQIPSYNLGASQVALEVRCKRPSRVPGWGRSQPVSDNPLQYSYLENSMDRGAWWAFKLWCWINRCESWTIKKADCLRIDAFKLWCWRKLESPLDSKEIKPVNPKGKQPWIFTERPEYEAEAPILWPPDIKSQLTRKDPNAGKDWEQEKGATEEEMIGWHHQLNGPGSEQTLGDSERLSTPTHTYSIFIECPLCARHYSNYEKEEQAR